MPEGQPLVHQYLIEEGRYSFLCAACPLNEVGQFDAAVGAARADRATQQGTSIGQPRTELGHVIRACRLARRDGQCADTEAVQGMGNQMLDERGQLVWPRYHYEATATNADTDRGRVYIVGE